MMIGVLLYRMNTEITNVTDTMPMTEKTWWSNPPMLPARALQHRV